MSDFYRIKLNKYLLWTCESDTIDEFWVESKTNDEIQVCDCFVDIMFIFLREIECVSDVNDLKETFDDITLENNDEEDVYSIFGKVCVVCCKTALY